MNKKYIILFLFNSATLFSCETPSQQTQQTLPLSVTPMNAAWFYNKKSSYYSYANSLHNSQQWKDASESYKSALAHAPITNNSNSQDKYDFQMAQLNLAACEMAQTKPSSYWQVFDDLINIDEKQRISNATINSINTDANSNKTILIKTNYIGIGDIFHFINAVTLLKKHTQWKIALQIPPYLTQTLQHTANTCGFSLYTEKSSPTITDYTTHLIALLGYLELTPEQIKPEHVMFDAPDRVLNTILNVTRPHTSQGKKIIIADRGEVGRIATVMGGRQLKDRHLDSEGFNDLLKKYPDIILLDCGKEKSIIEIDEKYTNRRIFLPEEEYPFDMVIGLGIITKDSPNFFIIGPDMGQNNVLISCISDSARNKAAIIIPNADEHDMRMSGEGTHYKHMLANCLVYKCNQRKDQSAVIDFAYKNMLKSLENNIS